MNGGTSKLRTLGSKELLMQLPMLQHLLQRLVDCKPTGRAAHDEVVQVRLAVLPHRRSASWHKRMWGHASSRPCSSASTAPHRIQHKLTRLQ